jgi:hypothetical protein
VLPVARLTGNPWCQAADLLLDEGAGPVAQQALDVLVDELADLPWPLARLDLVPFEAPRWRTLRASLARAELTVDLRTHFRVGQVEVPTDWSELESGWSKNHRHKLRRLAAKLKRDGGAELERPDSIAPSDAPGLLRRALEMEDDGWKGAAGTSVLRSPGVLDFYGRLAGQLAAWDQLEVAFLRLAGRPIAFGYGYRAKGVARAAKIGYVESAASYSPVHVLLEHLLRAYHGEGDVRLLDFVGPLQDWTNRWATTSYPVGRLTIAPRRPMSRVLVRAYAAWQRRSGKMTEAESAAGNDRQAVGIAREAVKQ